MKCDDFIKKSQLNRHIEIPLISFEEETEIKKWNKLQVQVDALQYKKRFVHSTSLLRGK